MRKQVTSRNPFVDDALCVEPGDSGRNGDSRGREVMAARVRLLLTRRRLILRLAGAGLLLSTAVAFLIPKRFVSTTRLMPPDEANSNIAMLAASAAGQEGSSLSAMADDLLGLKSSGALFIGILCRAARCRTT